MDLFELHGRWLLVRGGKIPRILNQGHGAYLVASKYSKSSKSCDCANSKLIFFFLKEKSLSFELKM